MDKKALTETRRLSPAQPIARFGAGGAAAEQPFPTLLGEDCLFMMGDNPALPKMPERPRLLDFYRLRFGAVTTNHLLQSAKLALDGGFPEKTVMACLVHDIANGALIRTDHGFWGAQLIAPYVDEEIAWAVQHHQVLRFFPDESVGYAYPDSYIRFFGRDYRPPEYIRRAYESARNHRWYMTGRQITLNDIYSFKEGVVVDPDIFTDIIGRHFREPEEGLGFDNSPVAHMWRTMIWPNNLL